MSQTKIYCLQECCIGRVYCTDYRTLTPFYYWSNKTDISKSVICNFFDILKINQRSSGGSEGSAGRYLWGVITGYEWFRKTGERHLAGEWYTGRRHAIWQLLITNQNLTVRWVLMAWKKIWKYSITIISHRLLLYPDRKSEKWTTFIIWWVIGSGNAALRLKDSHFFRSSRSLFSVLDIVQINITFSAFIF